MRQLISYGIFTELCVVLLTLIFRSNPIAAIAGPLLVLIGAAALFLLLLWSRWGEREWYLMLVVFLLLFFVADKLVIDIFGSLIDLAYVILLLIAWLIFVLPSLTIVKYIRKHGQPIPATAREKDATVNMPIQPRRNMRAFRKKRTSSRSRHLFILQNFSIPKTMIERPRSMVSAPILTNFPQSFATEEAPRTEAISRVEAPRVEAAQETLINYLQEPSLYEEEIPAPKETFIASTNGKRFHTETCMISTRIPKEKRLTFDNAVDVVHKGFAPCGVCNPLKLNISGKAG